MTTLVPKQGELRPMLSGEANSRPASDRSLDVAEVGGERSFSEVGADWTEPQGLVRGCSRRVAEAVRSNPISFLIVAIGPCRINSRQGCNARGDWI